MRILSRKDVVLASSYSPFGGDYSDSTSGSSGVDVRQAYVEWCQHYGKVPSDDRYPIFATNFMTQWNYDQQQQTETPTTIASVNEFADWTVEEFQQRQMAIEAKIRDIYQQWCLDYGKAFQGESGAPNHRYETFKANFLQNMKHYEQTGDFYQLNEYADLTFEEFQELVVAEEEPASAGDDVVRFDSDRIFHGVRRDLTILFVCTTFVPLKGAGLPSYLQGMVQPAGQPSFPGSSTTVGGAAMSSYVDALSSNSGAKPSSYLPKSSWTKTDGAGLSSFPLTPAGPVKTVNPFSSGWSPAPPAYHEPILETQPPQATSLSSSHEASTDASTSGAGMASYADALSGGNAAAAPKPASYLPKKSFTAPAGSGMPSYFDNLGGSTPSKPASYMPNKKSYNQPSGSGMSSSYFDTMNTAPTPIAQTSISSSASSWSPSQEAYQEPMLVSQPPQAISLSSYEAAATALTAGSQDGTGMASYADALSSSANSASSSKPASFMPNKSYKQSLGSGMPSYFDNMKVSPKQSSFMPGGSKSYKQSSPGTGMSSYFDNLPSSYESPSYPTPQYLEPTPPIDILPNIAPVPPPSPPTITSDQAAEFRRQHIPARGGPGQPLAYKMQNPQRQASDQSLEFIRRRRVEALARSSPLSEFPLAHSLKNPQLLHSDQHLIMRQGEGFLPHSLDPVIRRGNQVPGFFFSGQVPITEKQLLQPSARGMPPTRFLTSDQEKADVYARQSLMYFQRGPNVGRTGGQYTTRAYSSTMGAPRETKKDKNQKSSYMPTTYKKKSSGSGMPSYFDHF